MKKLILLSMLFLSISFIGYSEVKQESFPTVVDQVSQNVDQVVTEANPTAVYITEKLVELAKSLKVPAEHVYSVLVKQQAVNAYSIIIFFIIGIVLLLLSVKQFKLAQWGTGSSYYDSEDKKSPYWKGYLWNNHTTMFLIFVIMGGIITLGTSILFPQAISGILNPEYGALKEIMKLF